MHLCTYAYLGARVAACTIVNECGVTSDGTRMSTSVKKQNKEVKGQAMDDNIHIAGRFLAFAWPHPICVHGGATDGIGLPSCPSQLDLGNGEGITLRGSNAMHMGRTKVNALTVDIGGV